MQQDNNSITLSRVYQAPIELIWKAITDMEEMKKWYFDFAGAFRLELGHEFEWYAGPAEGKQWLHRGKITEIIDGRKLAHTWEYPGYSGSSAVTWELTPVDDNSTRLVLTHEFTIPFDSAEEALRRENFDKGWTHILDIGLTEYVNGS
jgi:uncharacterized protein YndB with AHSA1/START domain